MRDAEETCGHTVVDADGIEEPCGLPVALGGWRYYEGHEHEDTLRRVCADHEQWALSNGIRARDAEVRAEALAGFTEETDTHHRATRVPCDCEHPMHARPLGDDSPPTHAAFVPVRVRRYVTPWEPVPEAKP